MKPDNLSSELKALLEEVSSLPAPNLKAMEETNRALSGNPEFISRVVNVKSGTKRS